MRAIPYCGSAGIGMRDLLRAPARDACCPRWPQLADRRVVLTHSARTAVALACRTWRIGPGDEALVPAYNCGSEVDVLLKLGLTVRMYRVDRAARVDQDHLRSLCGPRTRLVLVIHYFGWPQDVRDLAAWCRARNIRLLEDCALALFSAGPDGDLGRLGDAAVFSLSKTLPVPDGGILSLPAAADAELAPLVAPPWRPLLRRTLPLLKARTLHTAESLGVYPLARRLLARSWLRSRIASNGAPLPDMPASYYFDLRLANCGVSRLTAGLIVNVDSEVVQAARRRNCRQLQQHLADVPGVRPLFAELPAGVCPLCFPVLVADRPRWLAALHARGVPAIGWWAGYHQQLPWADFPDARHLKDHLIALPVHQDLGESQIKYVVAAARMGARELALEDNPS